LKIATIRGIPIHLHWSFLGLMAIIVGGAVMQIGLPALLPATLLALGLCATVALHELGHAIAAQRYGYPTHDITLYFFGGIASIEATDEIADDPDEELVIALAGPAVNFGLVVVFGWFGLVGIESPVLSALASMNLIMGLFNMLPAFPMDGGRVLRALLAKRMGWLPASKLAMTIGYGFAVLFVVLGLVLWAPTIIAVGAFLFVALRQEKERLVAANFERASSGRDGDGWSRAKTSAGLIGPF